MSKRVSAKSTMEAVKEVLDRLKSGKDKPVEISELAHKLVDVYGEDFYKALDIANECFRGGLCKADSIFDVVTSANKYKKIIKSRLMLFASRDNWIKKSITMTIPRFYESDKDLNVECMVLFDDDKNLKEIWFNNFDDPNLDSNTQTWALGMADFKNVNEYVLKSAFWDKLLPPQRRMIEELGQRLFKKDWAL